MSVLWCVVSNKEVSTLVFLDLDNDFEYIFETLEKVSILVFLDLNGSTNKRAAESPNAVSILVFLDSDDTMRIQNQLRRLGFNPCFLGFRHSGDR